MVSPFEEFENEVLKLIKKDGTVVEGLRTVAIVNGKVSFFRDDVDFEEEDILERVLPNGKIENYRIEDVHYTGKLDIIPGHYTLKVSNIAKTKMEPRPHTITYNLNAPNSRVNNNSNDLSNNTINYQNITNIQDFTQAIENFREVLQNIKDEDEKEIGELRLRQLERAIKQDSPSENQWEKFFLWVTNTSTLVAGGAVLWNAGAAIGRSAGYDVPEAPQGLGQ